jgi:hypothetical protein
MFFVLVLFIKCSEEVNDAIYKLDMMNIQENIIEIW